MVPRVDRLTAWTGSEAPHSAMGFCMGSRSSQQEVREFAANYKQRLFTNLSGVVLEIGPGTETNLRYFTQPGIRWMGVEPTRYMEPYLEKEAKRLGMQIDLRTGLAHPLAVEDQQCR